MVRFLTLARFTSAWVTNRLNLKSERGATAVEYGIMVALIAAVIVGAVLVLGNNTNTTFTDTGNCVGDTSTC